MSDTPPVRSQLAPGQISSPRRLHAWLGFFFLLASWYVLRPLREEMGVRSGLESLDSLFLATFLSMLIVVPIYSALVARWPRWIFIRLSYVFFASNMVAFHLWMGLFGSGASIVAARVFYVWSSVFNLLAVSIFWSLMADLFTIAQGKRFFGVIATGGTLGALAGSAITALLAAPLGPENLLLISASLLLIATAWITLAGRSPPARSDRTVRTDAGQASSETIGEISRTRADEARRPIGGRWWAGFLLTIRSSYLRGICLYLFLLSLTSSFTYLTQLSIVKATVNDSAGRTALFATMNFAVNALTLGAQGLLAARVMARHGVGVALAVLPLLTLAGLLTLGLAPVLAVVVAFQVLRRATNFGLTRPAREVLFTRVGRESKYKAKSFIDTVFIRGSDALNARLYSLASGLGISGTLLLVTPLCLVWFRMARLLGKQAEREHGSDPGGQP